MHGILETVWQSVNLYLKYLLYKFIIIAFIFNFFFFIYFEMSNKVISKKVFLFHSFLKSILSCEEEKNVKKNCINLG